MHIRIRNNTILGEIYVHILIVFISLWSYKETTSVRIGTVWPVFDRMRVAENCEIAIPNT